VRHFSNTESKPDKKCYQEATTGACTSVTL